MAKKKLSKEELAMKKLSALAIAKFATIKEQNSVKARVSTIENAGFVTKAVNDLVNYYKKSETYTQSEIDSLLATIEDYSVVFNETIPVSGEGKKLYLIPSQDHLSYSEYIWVNNSFKLLATHSGDISIFIKTIDNIDYKSSHSINKNSATENGLLKQDGNIDTSVGGYVTSPFISIPVSAVVVYLNNVFPTIGSWCGFCLYDENHSIIMHSELANVGSAGSGVINLIKYPNAKYYRFSPSKAKQDSTVMFGYNLQYFSTIVENGFKLNGLFTFWGYNYVNKTNSLLKTDGTVDESIESTRQGYRTTDFIKVDNNSFIYGYHIFPQGTNWVGICVYDSNKNFICFGGADNEGFFEMNLATIPDASYIRVSFNDYGDGYFYISNNFNVFYNTLISYLPKKTVSWKNTVPNNKLLKEDGSVDDIAGYFTSEFIEINGLVDIDGIQIFPYMGNGWVGVCLYDNNKNLITKFGGSGDNSAIKMKNYIPAAKYLRFSLKSTQFPSATMTYTCISADKNNKTYYVKKDGSGDFTTLVECIRTASSNLDSVVYVDDGIYDIIEEFKTVYGVNYLETTNSDKGLSLRNRIKVVFSSNAKIVCNYTGNNNFIMKEFSVFNAGIYGFTLVNANINASRIRYCVHDEHWDDTDRYENYYIGCDMYLDNTNNESWSSKQCIGGGFGTNGFVKIENCSFESNGADGSSGDNGSSVSWHNCPIAGKSKLIVNSSYFKGRGALRLSWHGDSVEKTPVYISGNSFGSPIIFRAETSSSENQNIEIFEWNNLIRN